MATLSLEVPDAIAMDVLNALKWKYPDVNIDGLTNVAAARRIVRNMLRDVYLEWLVTQKNIELEAQFDVQRAAARAQLEQEVATITG